MSAQLNINRLKAICEEWSRINNKQTAEPTHTTAEDGTPLNALFMVTGTTIPAVNQRGASMIQFLFNSGSVPTYTGLVISRPAVDSPISAYTATFLSTVPINVTAATDANAEVPQVVTNTIAAASADSITAADVSAKLLATLTATATSPTAVAYVEVELTAHAKVSGFAKAAEEAFRALPATTNNAVKLFKAQRLMTALLAPKYDNDAVMCVRRANAVYGAVLKTYVVPQLDAIAAQNSANVTAGFMRTQIGNYLNAANTMPGYEKLQDWRAFAYVVEPQVLVKGRYTTAYAITDEAVSAATDAEIVSKTSASPVTIRLSLRSNEQCVMASRSYFFKETAPANAGDALEYVAAVESLIVAKINEAVANANNTTTVRDIAKAVIADAATKIPNGNIFAQYLVADFGHLVSSVLTDKYATIADSDTSALVVRGNTTYYVRAALQNVVSAADNKTFDVEVSDTVIAGAADDLVKRAPRTFPAVLLLPDDDPSREATNTNAASGAAGDDNNASGSSRKVVTRSGGVAAISQEEARINKQAKLWDEKEREFANAGPKPKSEDPANELTTIGRIANGTAASYANRAALAQQNLSLQPGSDKLFANAPALTVWVPIGGKVTPFHMSTIKEIAIRADGTAGYVCTITFHSLQESYLAFRANRTKMYVRELSYRAMDTAMFDAVRNAVIIGQEKIKEADKRRQSEKGLISSSNLGVRGAVTAKLPNVFIRPQVYAKISNRGTFEANDKGFRFDFSGGGLAAIEVPYDNVAFCICQPSQNDVQVLFHVVLHKPIQWGKEKNGVKEFQVAAVVLEASEGVNGRRKMSEAEEIAQEEADRARVAATNKEFIDFSRAVNAKHVGNVFAPNKSYDIDGSLGKGNVRVRGSNKALWQITETPFQSVLFNEVEIAMLERMIIGGKTFDLVLVPKNYRNKVVTISSIPMKKADEVKNWLCGADVVYIEIGTNQNYPRLFKQFESDPEWNPWDRQGWRAMVEDDDEEADESGSSDDDSWEGSSEEDDESDDSDGSFDEDSDDFEDSSSGASGAGGADSDASGDWSDMERRAEAEDEEDESDASSEDARPKKKARTGNAGPAAGGRGGMFPPRGGMSGRGGAVRR